jgi:hypothetical protein
MYKRLKEGKEYCSRLIRVSGDEGVLAETADQLGYGSGEIVNSQLIKSTLV